MATTIEYALMAGRAYQTTRGLINQFPIPLGWFEIAHVPNNPGFPQFTGVDGFEAVAFQKGSDIVISFAGTNPNSLLDPDNEANIGLATGFGSAQLLQAAEYYLQVKAANPTANITFTGHSLGGGLAALMGVFFGRQAVTFDQAPFAKSAELSLLHPDVAANLKADLLARGYNEADLSGLTDFLQLRTVTGGIPNSSLVTDINVQGEVLSSAPAALFNRIGTQADIPDSANGVSGFDLHSQALLTVFLQSMQTALPQHALNDVTYKLTDLMGMIFSSSLFAHPTNDPTNQNFLERLVQHEAGVGTALPADQMVTRFTNDLWKLAQDGGLTIADDPAAATQFVSKALTAFAMQMYYEDTANAVNASKELFTDLATASIGSGGVQFDRADVAATLGQAKGYNLYFQEYLLNAFSDSERQVIQSLLPTLRDWYVQAGSGGMNATDAHDRGAFMLGGSGADNLTGGSQNDLLVGNAGADTLNGGAGADTMLGDQGDDTYYVDNSGDIVTEYANNGSDTVQSSVSYELTANVENLTLAGSAITGTGNDLKNTITGNALNNTLDGGAEADKLIGGAGNDTYIVDDVHDQVIEQSGEGADTVQSSVDIRLTANVERLILTGGTLARGHVLGEEIINQVNGAILSGGQGDDTYTLEASGTVVETAGDGMDTVQSAGSVTLGNNIEHLVLTGSAASAGTGNDQDNTITGNDAANTLRGGAGSDILQGGLGNDALAGGAGNDLLEGGAGDEATFTILRKAA